MREMWWRTHLAVLRYELCGTRLDRALAVGLKLAGTIACIPCALPLTWTGRLTYLQFLHRVFYRDLTQELPWWFRKYLEIVVVGQNIKYGFGKTYDDYMENAAFQCEDGLGYGSLAARSERVANYIRQRFPLPEAGAENACVQFSGGKDSTLAALVASVFHSGTVNLLVFQHKLIKGVDKTARNVELLTKFFGDRYQLMETDIEKPLREIYCRDYWRDLKRYGLEIGGFFCGACRTAMHMATVLYCLENQISAVYDGANSSGFDMSQRPWYVEDLGRFYGEFGITYVAPTLNIRRSDKILREILGDQVGGSQPECQGGGEPHNILWRCHSLDKHGRDGHEKILREWLAERLLICRELIMHERQIHKTRDRRTEEEPTGEHFDRRRSARFDTRDSLPIMTQDQRRPLAIPRRHRLK